MRFQSLDNVCAALFGLAFFMQFVELIPEFLNFALRTRPQYSMNSLGR